MSRDLPKELAKESMTYREAPDKILNYCAPDCNLDMLKRDLLDIKQEPDEVATKLLKRSQASGQTDQPSISGVNSVQQEAMMEMKPCGLHNCAMEKEENLPELECSAEYGRKSFYQKEPPVKLRSLNVGKQNFQGCSGAA
uniref:Uncharacterized protein n=1 Tax=Romanomermis culicivorax TaxID=13658 RepID=A0A915HXI6_ROMCU